MFYFISVFFHSFSSKEIICKKYWKIKTRSMALFVSHSQPFKVIWEYFCWRRRKVFSLMLENWSISLILKSLYYLKISYISGSAWRLLVCVNSSFMKPCVVAVRIIIYFLAAMSPEQETRHSLLERQLIIKLETWDRAGDGNTDSALCDYCHEETLF